jgi:MFS family permease
MPVAGKLSDNQARVPIVGGAVALAGLGLGVLLVASSVLTSFLGITIFAAGLMAFPPVMQAHLVDTFPDSSMGGDFGAVRTIYLRIGSTGTTFVGVIAKYTNYTIAYSGLIFALLASAGVILWSSIGR